MSVKLHEAFSMDSFMDRLLFFDDFHGDQLQDEWREAGTGSAAVVDAQTGGIVRITTGATSGDAYYIDWQSIRSLHVSKKVTMEARLKVGTHTNNNVTFDLFFDATNRVGFTYDTTGAETEWFLRCADGVTTKVNSGITVDTIYHIFRIECFPTDEVHFYIDGVEPGTSPITTNIPDDVGDYLQPRYYLRTRENVAHTLDIDYVYIRQER